ncbi:MAG: cell division protein ZipA [Gammaproteobacteria bacterium]|nr:cell division protein ZipA [Gammaproteobacteria bacterium]
MDPDLIRLILVILGVLLVIGIYAWDRYKRSAPPARMGRQAPQAWSDDDMDDDSADSRREPVIESQPDRVPEMTLDEDSVPVASKKVSRESRTSELDPEPVDLGEWSRPSAEGDPQFAMDLDFDVHGDNDYLHTDPALADDVERKIIVVNVVAKGTGQFAGPAIEKACADVDLVLGEMAIYHRHDQRTGKVLFSMASMVEPGSFPVPQLRTFSTPGLSIFTQLPGVRDGVEIYDAMLHAARQLASTLQGEVQDERRNKMTGQMEKHVRESIVEHRRRLKLSRSRH